MHNRAAKSAGHAAQSDEILQREHPSASSGQSPDSPARARLGSADRSNALAPAGSLSGRPFGAIIGGMTRETKITFAEMREMGVRGLLVYCSDYKCSHSTAISGERWADDVRLSDIEPLFVCQSCGKRGADVRPDFNWNKEPVEMDGLTLMCAPQ